MDTPTNHVPEHDGAPSEAPAASLVHQPPPMPPPKRTSTVLSSATQISVKIRALAETTCHNCNSSISRMHTFHFTRRNSIRNPLRCNKCGALVLQVGGSKQSSSSKKPAGIVGHGSDEAESSIPKASSNNGSTDDYKPYNPIGLPSPMHAARAKAISETESSMPVRPYWPTDDPESDDDEGRDGPIMNVRHTEAHRNTTISSNHATSHPQLQGRRKRAIVAHHVFHAVVGLLPQSWREKLARITKRIHKTVDNKGKEPILDIEGSAMPNAPAGAGAISYSSLSPPPNCSGCGCEPCHCSNLAPRSHSEYSSPTPRSKPEPMNRSQMLLGLTHISNWPDKFRWSMASSDMLSSHAAADAESGRSRTSPTPGPGTLLSPLHPQMPHHTAGTAHATGLAGGAHHHNIGEDSGFQTSPRHSNSFVDATP